MQGGGVSGFHNAPVTRAIVLASGLLSVVFSVNRRARALGLSYQDIIKNFRVWRIFASVFAFQSTPELMFGVYLLYYFRVFERQMGSNKYSVFSLFTIAVSLPLEILSLVLLKDTNYITALASGPYGLIFASFIPFFLDIPITSRFRIFGVNFSDKSFIYLAGLQLLVSSWKRSLIPGICGLIAGLLYRLNVLGIRRRKVIRALLLYRLHFCVVLLPFSLRDGLLSTFYLFGCHFYMVDFSFFCVLWLAWNYAIYLISTMVVLAPFHLKKLCPLDDTLGCCP